MIGSSRIVYCHSLIAAAVLLSENSPARAFTLQHEVAGLSSWNRNHLPKLGTSTFPISISRKNKKNKNSNYFSTSRLFHHNEQRNERLDNLSTCSRRQLISDMLVGGAAAAGGIAISMSVPDVAFAEEGGAQAELEEPVQVVVTGDIKKLFNEGRALESQGNIAAAQRLYVKVTRLAPRFIYGWASLGNTQVALGALPPAEASYTRAIDLCVESNKAEEQFGIARCNDLYLLHLNRGSLLMNLSSSSYGYNKESNRKNALRDLEKADALRGKPDAIILQNRARARELNGLYPASDRDYTVAISMTSNEVAPFWLRSALVKFQMGDSIGSMDLIRRVENKFPEAPEVRAALATMLWAKGDGETARKKFLQIPDRARLKYVDEDYLKGTVAWPPKMLEYLDALTESVGDKKKVEDVVVVAADDAGAPAV